jgi:AcrR family transcriptional regulator
MKRRNNVTEAEILDAAERLFNERGYTGVTLQQIAAAVHMRHASLYYYAPQGKEQLYVAVMERTFRQHGDGLMSAIIEAGDDLRAQIHAVARWFALRPPLDLGRIVHADMPAINPADAQRLVDVSLQTLRAPIAAAIRAASKRDVVNVSDPDLAAMGLVALLQSIHNIPHTFVTTPEAKVATAQAAADMLLYGWLKR